METESSYKQFNLLNKEFTFDVDVSALPCGVHASLYMVKMDKDGGQARFPYNVAGAKYGTGYCDAGCSRREKFVDSLVSLPFKSCLLGSKNR